MFGIVLLSTFLIAITSFDRFASDCLAGNWARMTWTLKFPLGSLASWRAPPPPHPATTTAARQAMVSKERRSVRDKARERYHRLAGLRTSFILERTFLGCVR